MLKTRNFFLIGLFWLLALGAGAETQSRLTFYHTDLNGTVLATTDETGNLKWRRSHAPYGEPLTEDTHPETVAYTGHVQDKSTGLVYMQARYYDPRTGRFLSQDPAGFIDSNPMSFNRYAYANNNPYRYVDPNGESPVDIFFLAVDGYKLGEAIASGESESIRAAAIDFGLSAVGMAIPVPGVGQMLKAAKMADRTGDVAKGAGNYRPDRKFPRDKHGNPVPDSDAPHTQLGTKNGRNGDYTQGREWGSDSNGKLVPKRDIDFTDHGRPQNHPNPHQHDWVPNPTGGIPQHGPAKPLEWP